MVALPKALQQLREVHPIISGSSFSMEHSMDFFKPKSLVRVKNLSKTSFILSPLPARHNDQIEQNYQFTIPPTNVGGGAVIVFVG